MSHAKRSADWNGANFDQQVDLADFSILKSHFGTGQYRNQGDFTADGRVNLGDFTVLKANFGKEAAVPEPSTWLLALLGLVPLATLKWLQK